MMLGIVFGAILSAQLVSRTGSPYRILTLIGDRYRIMYLIPTMNENTGFARAVAEYCAEQNNVAPFDPHDRNSLLDWRRRHTRQPRRMIRWRGRNSLSLRPELHWSRQFIASRIADRREFWWNPKRPDERVLWESRIYLGETFFNEIIQHSVPLDMNTLKALKRSSPGLDLYALAHLPHLCADAPDVASLAAVVPPVRGVTHPR